MGGGYFSDFIISCFLIFCNDLVYNLPVIISIVLSGLTRFYLHVVSFNFLRYGIISFKVDPTAKELAAAAERHKEFTKAMMELAKIYMRLMGAAGEPDNNDKNSKNCEQKKTIDQNKLSEQFSTPSKGEMFFGMVFLAVLTLFVIPCVIFEKFISPFNPVFSFSCVYNDLLSGLTHTLSEITETGTSHSGLTVVDTTSSNVRSVNSSLALPPVEANSSLPGLSSSSELESDVKSR